MINLDAFHPQLFLLFVICTMAVQRREETAGKQRRSSHKWLTSTDSETLPVRRVSGGGIVSGLPRATSYIFVSFHMIISLWTEWEVPLLLSLKRTQQNGESPEFQLELEMTLNCRNMPGVMLQKPPKTLSGHWMSLYTFAYFVINGHCSSVSAFEKSQNTKSLKKKRIIYSMYTQPGAENLHFNLVERFYVLECHTFNVGQKKPLPGACWPSRQTVSSPQGCWGPQSNLLYQSEPRWTSSCGKRLHTRNKDSDSSVYLDVGVNKQRWRCTVLCMDQQVASALTSTASLHTHCWSAAVPSGWLGWRWAQASPGLSSPLCRPLPPPPGWSHSRDPTPEPAGACSSSLGPREGGTQRWAGRVSKHIPSGRCQCSTTFNWLDISL